MAGTIPDLDVFIDHGDPIRNMVLHRARSFFVLADAVFAAIFSRAYALGASGSLFKRWWLAMWLTLVTHPLLDGMTFTAPSTYLCFTDTPMA
jgi:inner membrane protein